MRCWLYIILFVSYTDAKCCREKKHNSVARAVATEASHQSCCHLYTKVEAKKKICRRTCKQSEYSETEDSVCQGMSTFTTTFAFLSLLAQK